MAIPIASLALSRYLVYDSDMRKIPKKLRDTLAADPYYSVCARKGLHGHTCAGRITWEHAIIYAGKQVNERWAIIPLCEKAHNVGMWQDCGDFNKRINEWIALSRATTRELLEISKARDHFQYLAWLEKIFGKYHEPTFAVQKGEYDTPTSRIRYEIIGMRL